MKRHWAADYVGIPYREGGRTRNGVDCWGLLCLVYQERFGVELPPVPLMDKMALSLEDITKLRTGWQEIEGPEDGCAIAMGDSRRLYHVGVWVDVDGGKVLHARSPSPSVLQSFQDLSILGFTKIRFYTWHGL